MSTAGRPSQSTRSARHAELEPDTDPTWRTCLGPLCRGVGQFLSRHPKSINRLCPSCTDHAAYHSAALYVPRERVIGPAGGNGRMFGGVRRAT